jgi:hypothetical protein
MPLPDGGILSLISVASALLVSSIIALSWGGTPIASESSAIRLLEVAGKHLLLWGTADLIYPAASDGSFLTKGKQASLREAHFYSGGRVNFFCTSLGLWPKAAVPEAAVGPRSLLAEGV